MFKKVLSLALALVLVLSLTAVFAGCAKEAPVTTTPAGNDASATDVTEGGNDAAADLKIGVILVGDENEGYTFAHMEGIKNAAKALGIADTNILWKYTVKEDETCLDAAMDLANQGCQLIISNSYGHQAFMQQAAEELEDVQFIAMTGDTAQSSGLANFNNGFTKIFESRYVSGVVAGMKLKELIDAGKITDKNKTADGLVKIGYVGAYPYAEVVSGYTAFFLGIRSIVPETALEVQYTNSWFDLTAEGETAKSLVADGCVIIGQHADSTGAPSAVEALLNEGTVCYSVGYNVDMLSVAPNAALTSATNNWSVYYTAIFTAMLNGQEIPKEFAAGYEADGVRITDLGASCAEGTKEKVAEVEAAIKAGELKVFDTSTWTVGGQTLTSYDKTYGYEGNEMISDGYFHESELRSAPCFDIRIDGITELN